MDDLLVVLIQCLAEVAWEMLLYFGFDWPASKRSDRSIGTGFTSFGLFLIGLGIGYGVSLVLPYSLIHHGFPRLAIVVLGPLLTAYASYRLALWRIVKWGGDIDPRRHAITGACFTAGYSIARVAMTWHTVV